MTTTRTRAPRRTLLAAVIAALLGAAAAVVAPAAAQAAENPSGTAIYGPGEFFAYVGVGESIDWDFVKLQGNSLATLQVNGPAGWDSQCSVTTPGTECQFGVLSVTVPGIWHFQFTPAGNATATDHATTWNIEVTSQGVEIPGRVWTEEYEMTNLDFSTTVDFDFWYLGEFGDLYRADYTDFNGVNSTFLASGVGLVRQSGATCVPQYRSSQRANQLNPADSSPALRPLQAGECGGRYKIFFQTPDLGMPATAERWDGSTTWLLPPVTDPVVSGLAFHFSDAGAMTGKLDFTVTDFQGTLDILVDANGDGDTDDAVDRVIPYFVSSTAPADHSYTFDGLDGLGAHIQSGQNVIFTVSIARTGEVHFVNTDVETRGGLQILSLRGPDAGDDRLYFDDRVFGGSVSADKCSDTPVLDGRAGIHTSGGPVHGWQSCGFPVNVLPTNANDGAHGSWGDSRHIHDWTYRSVSVSASIPVVGQEALAATGSSPAGPALLAAGLLLGGLVLLSVRRAART
jgi:hypothetical protein